MTEHEGMHNRFTKPPQILLIEVSRFAFGGDGVIPFNFDEI